MTDFFNIPYIITTYGYLGIFLIVFLESGIFFPLPGDSLLFTAGLFASAFGLNIFFLVPMIFVATFLGGLAGYDIGAHLVKLQNVAFLRKILRQDHIDKAHIFFNKHGKFAVTFCRFVPIIRTFVPIVAGVAKMNYSSFIKYSIAGSALWSTVVTLLGFFLGLAFPAIKSYLWVVILLIILASLLPVIFQMVRDEKA